jgi:TM2 domain-containing membrane protein YozV
VGSKNEPVVQQKNGNEISPHKIVENRPINRGKSKSIAALLGFLFGTFGVHRLYLGNWGIGLLIPAAWMFSAIIDSQGLFFIVIILIVVDIVRLITLSDHEFNAKYNSKEVHPFQFIW